MKYLHMDVKQESKQPTILHIPTFWFIIRVRSNLKQSSLMCRPFGFPALNDLFFQSFGYERTQIKVIWKTHGVP